MSDTLIKAAWQHHQAGRFADAARIYRSVLKENPANFVALQLLGFLHFQCGEFADAERIMARAVTINHNSVETHYYKGCALYALGRFNDALTSYGRALSLKGDHCPALLGLANTYARMGRYLEAIMNYDKVMILIPASPELLLNRGNALLELGRHSEALASYELALKQNSHNAILWNNRGSALIELGRDEDALTSYTRATELNPSYAEAFSARGYLLAKLGRKKEALLDWDKALALEPKEAAIWNARGVTLLSLKRFDDALRNYDGALRLNLGDSEIWSNRARVLFQLGRFVEAMADCDRALAIDPGHVSAARIAVQCRLHCCDWRKREEDKKRISTSLAAGRRVVDPLDHRRISDSESEHLIAARLWAAEECTPSAWPLWRGERYRHKKIRIAYLSTDFRDHAVAFLICGVLEHHDRSRFETIAISLGPNDRSQMRRRIEVAFDHFVDGSEMSDVEIASKLYAMEIDIVIDLNGYSGDSRTGILARRPAPLQVNYLGYPGTTGAEYMDYIIADAVVIPPERRIQYTEKVVYLPDTYQPSDDKRAAAPRNPSRAEVGLPEGGFVFCSFGKLAKIAPEVFDVWMRLLHKIDRSVLWLLKDNPISVANIKREAEARGVSADRLIFAPLQPSADHLARHRVASLFLDTLPYNAHTTANDALRMALPLVTCRGHSFPSRVAASLLGAIGLPELVTESLDEYESLSIKLAVESGTLDAIRSRLAANYPTHPLFDTVLFTRYLECAYATMWERSERGLSPEPFAVPPL